MNRLGRMTIDIQIDNGQVRIDMHGVGPAWTTEWADDPQQAWEQIADRVAGQIVAAGVYGLASQPGGKGAL